MLTVLRKIRRSLIESDSTRSYLLYAIGEISLVVMSILIALQINNWQNDRNIRKLEIATLGEIQLALIQDTAKINQNLAEHSFKVSNTKKLLDHMNAGAPYEPSLDVLFSIAYRPFFGYNYNIAVYDLVKERGTDIISNKNLRRNIGVYYSQDHSTIRYWLQKLSEIHLSESKRIYPFFVALQEPGKSLRMQPLDYDSVRKRKDITNAIYHFRSLNVAVSNYLGNFKRSTEDLLIEVENELDNLK